MALQVRQRPVGLARRWRLAVGVVAALNAFGALGGALGLVSGWLSLGEVTDRLPFGSTVLAGLALALLVCLPQSVLTGLAFRGSRATAAASLLVGGLLVCWILLEVVVLHVLAGLQVTYLVVGLVQVGLGILLGQHAPGGIRAGFTSS